MWWSFSGFDSGETDAADEGLGDSDVVRVPARAVPSFQGNVDGATEHIARLLGDGWRVVALRLVRSRIVKSGGGDRA